MGNSRVKLSHMESKVVVDQFWAVVESLHISYRGKFVLVWRPFFASRERKSDCPHSPPEPFITTLFLHCSFYFL